MTKDYLNVRIESQDFDSSLVEIHKLTGRERISQLFRFELEIVYKKPEGLPLEDLAGAEVVLVFERANEQVRRLFGMVARVDDLFDTEEAYTGYRLLIVPRAWRMTLIETLDIFQKMSVPQIIRKKLELIDLVTKGIDYEFRLLDQYPEREFVVQYEETDLAFISRLAEHEGISFFFEHGDERDKIVFVDRRGGFRPIVGSESTVNYSRRGEQVGVYGFELQHRLIPGAYVVRDFNYRTPQLELQADHELDDGYGGGIIEYGTHCETPEQAERYAEIRAQQHHATREVYCGSSDTQTFSPGAIFELTAHPRVNPKLLLLEVDHSATQSVAGRGGGEERTYTNSFRAIDASEQYRPPRITPKPRIPGLITGIVEQGQEDDVGKFAKIDGQGRYTVKFLFDTAPPGDNKASRPVRRLQPSAGPNYGMHFPLRPGVEVSLAFVNGDPDRPLIVGAVPNPLTPTPVDEGIATKNRIKPESGVLFEIEDGQGS